MLAEDHEVNVAISKGQGTYQLIARHNVLLDDMKTQLDKLDKLDDDREKMLMSRSDYISATLDASAKADLAAHSYDSFASDKTLTTAIGTHNLTAKPMVKLGPSVHFSEDLELVKKCKSDVTSGIIPITLEGGVPNVEVLINGKVTETFIWDSGCTGVTLSAKTATALGLHPTDKDPVVVSTIADGSKVKEHLMMVDSIRIGSFTVEHVECIVPDGGSAGADLLGNEFQHHFQFKLDVNAATLQLTPIDARTEVAAAPRSVVIGVVPPSTQPSPPTQAPAAPAAPAPVAPTAAAAPPAAPPSSGCTPSNPDDCF